MLTRLIFAVLLADAAPDPNIYGPLGALAILSTACWTLWRALQAERSKMDDFLNRFGPLLAQAVTLLSTTPDRIDKTLDNVAGLARANDLAATVRKMEALVEHLLRRS